MYIVILIIGVVALLIIVPLIARLKSSGAEKQTDDCLQETAARRNWQFINKSSIQYLDKFRHLEAFDTGQDNYASNMLEFSSDGAAVKVFEHHYRIIETSYLSDNHRSEFFEKTVVHLAHDSLNLPQFVLKPQETALSSNGGLLADANFSAHPSLSKIYTLKGRYPEKAVEIFTPEIQDFFEKNQNLCVEGWNQDLLIQIDKLDCGEIEAFVERGLKLMELFISAGQK